jgi:hypothetical protein
MSVNFFKVGKGLTLKGQSAAPGSPEEGDVYYDTTMSVVRVYQNGQWKSIDFHEGITTPSNPPAGFYKTYVSTSDNKLHILDSSGNDQVVGGLSGYARIFLNQ